MAVLNYVVNSSEPILKLVPQGDLVAQVFITNQDIGFVKEKMARIERKEKIEGKEKIEVDVRIDSFPYSEFGDVKGELEHIGSDALPPDEVHPFYRFPATVKLNQQSMMVNQGKFPLQSGMSVSVNIKLRKRRVISMFADLFVTKVDSVTSGQ